MKPSELIADQSRHCKYCIAQDASGNDCSPFSPNAVRWDLSGAFARYTGLSQDQMRIRFLATSTWHQWCVDNAKSEHPMSQCLDSFNDSAYFHALQSAFDESSL